MELIIQQLVFLCFFSLLFTFCKPRIICPQGNDAEVAAAILPAATIANGALGPTDEPSLSLDVSGYFYLANNQNNHSGLLLYEGISEGELE